MTAPELSVVVVAGSSVATLHTSLRSVGRACAALQAAHALPTELLVVVPEHAREVRSYLDESVRQAVVQFTSAAQRPPERRQIGRNAARGRFVASLDAGDMWSGNWLREAYGAARREASRHSVWHPEIVIGSGHDYWNFQDVTACYQPEMLDADDAAVLLFEAPYAPSCLLHRSVLEAVEYPSADVERGFEDVDAWWIAETVGSGYAHRVVEGTALYRWNERAGAVDARFGPSRCYS